jgi:hypothetical protein
MLRNLALVLAACGASACSDLGPEDGLLAELERNERRWLDARPEAYVFAVERLCFCGEEARGPVRVRVEGSTVTERTYVETGLDVPPVFAELFPTVHGLFEILRAAIVEQAHEVRATYDPVLGVPIDFWIDYRLNVADEELGMRVTEGVGAVSE